jgi:general secretion pathway protein B
MSYILNALRKSEQERQASRPETLTEQVLTPSPPKSRKTAMVIGVLLAVNLLALLLLAWYLKKTDDGPAARPQVMPQKAARKPLPAAVKPADAETASGQETKRAPTAPAPVPQTLGPSVPVTATPAAKSPSIEELAAVKQSAEVRGGKLASPGKSERGAQTENAGSAVTGAGDPRQTLRKERQGKRAQPVPAAESLGGSESDAGEENNGTPPPGQDLPLFKDLPYNFRNSVPKMTVNVFVYDTKPEDRFVVLNMTKYKAGQITKDAVEIKEIRPDGIIASYGGRMFRIERP